MVDNLVIECQLLGDLFDAAGMLVLLVDIEPVFFTDVGFKLDPGIPWFVLSPLGASFLWPEDALDRLWVWWIDDAFFLLCSHPLGIRHGQRDRGLERVGDSSLLHVVVVDLNNVCHIRQIFGVIWHGYNPQVSSRPGLRDHHRIGEQFEPNRTQSQGGLQQHEVRVPEQVSCSV